MSRYWRYCHAIAGFDIAFAVIISQVGQVSSKLGVRRPRYLRLHHSHFSSQGFVRVKTLLYTSHLWVRYTYLPSCNFVTSERLFEPSGVVGAAPTRLPHHTAVSHDAAQYGHMRHLLVAAAG